MESTENLHVKNFRIYKVDLPAKDPHIFKSHGLHGAFKKSTAFFHALNKSETRHGKSNGKRNSRTAAAGTYVAHLGSVFDEFFKDRTSRKGIKDMVHIKLVLIFCLHEIVCLIEFKNTAAVSLKLPNLFRRKIQ